jgi:hypothetical protein
LLLFGFFHFTFTNVIFLIFSENIGRRDAYWFCPSLRIASEAGSNRSEAELNGVNPVFFMIIFIIPYSGLLHFVRNDVLLRHFIPRNDALRPVLFVFARSKTSKQSIDNYLFASQLCNPQ